MKKQLKITAIILSCVIGLITHPFLYVKAEQTPSSNLRILYSFINSSEMDVSSGETYLFCDMIFTSNALATGSAYMSYTYTGTAVSYSLYDGEGVTGITASTDSGIRTVTFTFQETNYFVVRIVIRGPSSTLNQTVLHNPTSAFGVSFAIDSVTYGDVIYTSEYMQSQVVNYLDQMLTNQETIIATLNDLQDLVADLTQEQQTENENTSSLGDTLQSNVDDVDNVEQNVQNHFDVQQSENYGPRFNQDLRNMTSATSNTSLRMNFGFCQTILDAFTTANSYFQLLFFVPVLLFILKRMLGG